ncbi:DUF1740-domain-containing protein [Rhizoclosmatium globosum]|uniref:DUF1740-domain-containing protein n=1 Tax=Rhizoclosmatium globosum TaxID=329046 RepID=A0A1Y2C9B3_9FUNG|nr:DUF1740-domain-containing protein [Rhizoclosmatium globosum]|eukprot:ORY43444.1 DUF1740-domain-containing protein [Rhizoclosmatium globosum]
MNASTSSGFLGSSLFPSFAPFNRDDNDNDNDEDKDEEASSNPLKVFATIESTQTQTQTTTTTTSLQTRTQPSTSFPAFTSFSFNASNQQIAPTPQSRVPPQLNHLEGDDVDMDNNYASSAFSNSKKKSKKNKKDKYYDYRDGNELDLYKSTTRDDYEWNPREKARAKVTPSGHKKSDVVYALDVGDSADGFVIPTFSKKKKQKAPSFLDALPDGFVVDRKGDSQNARFGSATAKQGVPRYISIGNRILGAPDSRYRIARDARILNSLVVYQLGGQKGDRIPEREYRIALRAKPIQFRSMMDQNAKNLTNEKESTLLQDFIAFPKTKKMAAKAFADPTEENEDEEDQFPKTTSSVATSSSIQESSEFIETTRRLNLRLENNPKNLSTWLELINLQDTLVTPDILSNTKQQAKLMKAITERKLTMYEKAMKHFPGALELLIPYLRMCEEAWGDSEPAKLLTLWDRVLKRSGNGSEAVQLWDRYLTFRMTSYLSFGVTGCVDAFEECLSVLREGEDSETLQASLLHFFTRLCHFLYDAGYTERAVALFQGQIEFSCFVPPAFENMPWQQRVDMFEDFWESECARVGEPGAMGWIQNVMGAEPIAGYSTHQADDGDESMEEEYARWFRVESESAFMNWAPQRSATGEKKNEEYQDGEEEEELDPFATIIFDDIRPFLFHLTYPNLKAKLVSNFMNLLSCPFNSTATSSPNLVTSEALMNVELMSNALISQFFPKTSTPTGNEMDTDTIKPTPTCPLKNFPLTLSSLVTSQENTTSAILDTPHITAVQESGNGQLDFIKNLVAQTWKTVDELDDIGIPVLLSVEACSSSIKAALKTGKAFLKEERMNLSLWCFYAGLEVARGKIDEARKIYQTAISSYRTFPVEQQHDAVLLHLKYSELEMDLGNYQQALWVLVSFADGSADISAVEVEKPSATRILKTRKLLNELTDRAIQKCNSQYQSTLQPPSSQAIRITSALITCTGLFEYLNFNSLEEPFKFFNEMLSRTGLLPALRESILEAKLSLHIRHSKRPGVFVRPGDLREALEAAVAEFPHNTVFLSRFAENEAKTKIENRVRRVLDSELKKNPSPTLWIFAIFSELHHHTGHTYNQNSVRSLFSRAHECPSARHCPSIWYLSIIFEILTGNLMKAKQLLFRAIRECPWSKKIYMLVMGELRGVFDAEEVSEMVGVMEEKEIRIRISV